MRSNFGKKFKWSAKVVQIYVPIAPLAIPINNQTSPSNNISPSNVVPQQQSTSPSDTIREVQRIKEADSTEEDLSKLSFKDRLLRMQLQMLKKMEAQPK